MNKCPEIQRQKQIHLRSNYDHCSSIEINCIAVFELRIKAEVNNWWNVGFCLSSLTARTLADQWEDSEAWHWPIRGHLNLSHTLPIDQFDVQMLCWDGSDLPGSDPHQDTDPCHASRAGETLTLLSLSKQIISQVLSWEFVFSHTFTRLRYIESLLVETFQSLSLFLDQHSSLYVTFNLMLLG